MRKSVPRSQLAWFKRKAVFSFRQMCRDSQTHMDWLWESCKVNPLLEIQKVLVILLWERMEMEVVLINYTLTKDMQSY